MGIWGISIGIGDLDWAWGSGLELGIWIGIGDLDWDWGSGCGLGIEIADWGLGFEIDDWRGRLGIGIVD